MSTSISSPVDIAVDEESDSVFWVDADLKRVESAALDGSKRHVLATDRVVQPVALAVQGAHVYWADQGWIHHHQSKILFKLGFGPIFIKLSRIFIQIGQNMTLTSKPESKSPKLD